MKRSYYPFFLFPTRLNVYLSNFLCVFHLSFYSNNTGSSLNDSGCFCSFVCFCLNFFIACHCWCVSWPLNFELSGSTSVADVWRDVMFRSYSWANRTRIVNCFISLFLFRWVHHDRENQDCPWNRIFDLKFFPCPFDSNCTSEQDFLKLNTNITVYGNSAVSLSRSGSVPWCSGARPRN